MTIVLDTHVWLWWAARPERLSTAARRAIDDADRIGVSTLSAWEVAMLVVGRRIELDRDIGMWVRQALAAPRVEALEPSPQAAIARRCWSQMPFPAIRSIA